MSRPPFCNLLKDLLGERDLTFRSFAAVAKVSHAVVHRIATGEQAPPAKRIEAWADLLNLKGARREEFVDAAWLARSPEHVQQMVQRLQAVADRRRRARAPSL